MPHEKKPGIQLGETFVTVGKLIHYYLEGWRYGYLDVVNDTTVRIRPITPYKGAQPRLVTVARENLRPV